MDIDEKYMQRCLQLAEKGLGTVAPNPMVGCVIVHQGKIIGEGYHQKYGEAHAEVNAVNSVHDKSLLKKSTLYVSLEPCAHYGKTPPCSDLIIVNEIPTVVIGTVDPFAKVAGKGIEKMQRAGIEVKIGILEKDCQQQNKRFFTFHEKKRPYIILKWAQTADGFIDWERNSGNNYQAAWITNQEAKRMVHKQRTEEAAVMVGTNTVEKDNPSLTVREWQGKNPIRIILDRNNRLKKNLNVFDGTTPTIVFTEKEPATLPNVEFVKIDFSGQPLLQIMDKLHQRDIQSVIIEGGYQLLTNVIQANLWDEAFVYHGPGKFGKGVPAPHVSGELVQSQKIENCTLEIIANSNK